jgi:transcription antitermination factor NusG
MWVSTALLAIRRFKDGEEGGEGKEASWEQGDNRGCRGFRRADREIPVARSHIMTRSSFEVGEQVRISSGPFASFSGEVEEIGDDSSRMRVGVWIYWRC